MSPRVNKLFFRCACITAASLLAIPLVLICYDQWRDSVFHAGYARGAVHGSFYVFYRGSLPPQPWLDAAWRSGNFEGWNMQGEMPVGRWIQFHEARQRRHHD